MRKAERIQHGEFQPRLLSAKNSAFYLDMSPSKFLGLVALKRLPAPKRIDGMVRWDRTELDASIDDMGEEMGNKADAALFGEKE